MLSAQIAQLATCVTPPEPLSQASVVSVTIVLLVCHQSLALQEHTLIEPACAVQMNVHPVTLVTTVQGLDSPHHLISVLQDHIVNQEPRKLNGHCVRLGITVKLVVKHQLRALLVPCAQPLVLLPSLIVIPALLVHTAPPLVSPSQLAYVVLAIIVPKI
jgi:hypothetical protein